MNGTSHRDRANLGRFAWAFVLYLGSRFIRALARAIDCSGRRTTALRDVTRVRQNDELASNLAGRLGESRQIINEDQRVFHSTYQFLKAFETIIFIRFTVMY